jgi:N6-L-threonylcarbamoyladenine synthase
MATVLAIETSCDETAVAIVKNRHVLSAPLVSQVATHARYGGVVPEVAARQHLESVNGLIALAMEQAGLDWSELDAIASTCTPGLVGALLVGLTAAKTLAMVHNKPFLGVHHLEGHIYASYLCHPELQPPFLCLLVSGGHTSLIHVKDCGHYELVGQTRDDAAGEAFDKVARMMKLGYPGGPIIDKLAQTGDPKAFSLPEGQVGLPGGGFHRYDSSFSGLKTAVLRLVQKLEMAGEVPVADVAASFQAAVARALTKRALAAAQDLGLDTIVIGGGVAANQGLRETLTQKAEPLGIKVLLPTFAFCTDNAAMIACAAGEHFDRGHRSELDLVAQSRLGIDRVMELYNSPELV